MTRFEIQSKDMPPGKLQYENDGVFVLLGVKICTYCLVPLRVQKSEISTVRIVMVTLGY